MGSAARDWAGCVLFLHQYLNSKSVFCNWLVYFHQTACAQPWAKFWSNLYFDLQDLTGKWEFMTILYHVHLFTLASSPADRDLSKACLPFDTSCNKCLVLLGTQGQPDGSAIYAGLVASRLVQRWEHHVSLWKTSLFNEWKLANASLALVSSLATAVPWLGTLASYQSSWRWQVDAEVLSQLDSVQIVTNSDRDAST